MTREAPAASAAREVRWRRAEVALGDVVGVLAHDLRNPLASLHGCAQTLATRGDELTEEQRRQFAEVIARQSERLDWLIRAAVALAHQPDGDRAHALDLATVLAAAAEVTGARTDTAGSAYVRARESAARLAVEAATFAVGASASVRVVADGTVVEIEGAERDLEGGGRRWKLDVADRLLEADGGCLGVVHRPDGVLARLRFRPTFATAP